MKKQYAIHRQHYKTKRDGCIEEVIQYAAWCAWTDIQIPGASSTIRIYDQEDGVLVSTVKVTRHE